MSGMVNPEQERRDVIARLTEAAELLVEFMDLHLLPCHGANIACAVRGARDSRDVAAVRGGLVAVKGSVRCAGPLDFGTDDPLVRIILTAMKYDPSVRSAARVRFSSDAWGILSDMGIESAESDAALSPESISTFDWGIASCCSKGVPDVIAIKSHEPENSAICILNEDPFVIAGNIIILSNRIH